jgi:hypothetical protein
MKEFSSKIGIRGIGGLWDKRARGGDRAPLTNRQINILNSP